MPESVESWWSRRQWSKGCAVPYPVGSFREEWTPYPVLKRQYHPDLNGGIVLSQIPPAAEVYLTWQCEVGHVFVATPAEQRSRPGTTRRRSVWCPECRENAQPTRIAPARRPLAEPRTPPLAPRGPAAPATTPGALARAAGPAPGAPATTPAAPAAAAPDATAGAAAPAPPAVSSPSAPARGVPAPPPPVDLTSTRPTASRPSERRRPSGGGRTAIESSISAPAGWGATTRGRAPTEGAVPEVAAKFLATGGRRLRFVEGPASDDEPVRRAPGEAFWSPRAPKPASAAEAELRRRLGARLDVDLGLNAVAVRTPFFDRYEVWPDFVIDELRVALEYDTPGRFGLEHLGSRLDTDRRKDRLLRAVGWEVVRVRCGGLPLLGPHDVEASGVTNRLVEALVDALRALRGDLIVDSYLRSTSRAGGNRA